MPLFLPPLRPGTQSIAPGVLRFLESKTHEDQTYQPIEERHPKDARNALAVVHRLPEQRGQLRRRNPLRGTQRHSPPALRYGLSREADRQLSARSGDRILGQHGHRFTPGSGLQHPSNARHIARLSSPDRACCVGAEIELLERGKCPCQPNGGGENEQERSQGDPEQEQQHPPATTRKPHRTAHGCPPSCPSWTSWA